MELTNNITVEEFELVKNIVSHFAQPNSVNFDLLFSAGMKGLIRAHCAYSPNRNTQFTTFAYSCIKFAVLNEFNKLRKVCFDSFQEEVISDSVVPTDDDAYFCLFSEKGGSDIADSDCTEANGNFADDLCYLMNALCSDYRATDLVVKHYGIGCKPQDYKQLAADYGLSAERIRQIVKGALGTIRRNPRARDIMSNYV